jgi:hypothetical protein
MAGQFSMFREHCTFSLLLIVAILAMAVLYYKLTRSTRGLRDPKSIENKVRREECQKQWSSRHIKFIASFAAPFFAILVVASGAAILWLRTRNPDAENGKVSIEQSVILAFWSVVPGLYLYVEYLTYHENLTQEDLEHMRHFQELTRNIWISVLVVLFALCVGRFIGGGD